jgi:hypothetical protein
MSEIVATPSARDPRSSWPQRRTAPPEAPARHHCGIDRRGHGHAGRGRLRISRAWVRSESSVIEVFTLIFLVALSVAPATWACAGGRALLALGRASVAHFASGRPRQPTAPRAVALAQATREA